MAKKPNSWREINNLTGKVTLKKQKRYVKPTVITTLSVILLGAFSYLIFFLVSSVLSFGGITTDGDNPPVQADNYVIIDLGHTSMHDLTPNEWQDAKNKNFNNHVKFIRDQYGNLKNVKSTSLRVEYAYDYLIEHIANYVVKNNVYKIFYPNVDKIKLVNVYSDLKTKSYLSEQDLEKDRFDVSKFNLSVQISYDNKIQSATIIVPVQLVGVESFYSNFYKFKMGDFIKNDTEDGTVWDQQTSVFGGMGQNLSFDHQNLNNNKLYETFFKNFETFFYKYQSTEFFANKSNSFNPYQNFLLTSVSEDDYLINNLPVTNSFDDNDYLVDLNQLANFTEAGLTANSFNNSIPSFIVLLKNTLVYSGKQNELIATKTWDASKYLPLFKIDHPHVIDQIANNSKVYATFVPSNFNLTDFMTSPLITKVASLVMNHQDLSAFLKTVANNLLESSDDNISKEILSWNFLPYEIYDVTHTKDYNGQEQLQWINEKYRVEQKNSFNGTEFSIIDRPTMFNIKEYIKSTYDLSKIVDSFNFFNNYLGLLATDSKYQNYMTVKIPWGIGPKAVQNIFCLAANNLAKAIKNTSDNIQIKNKLVFNNSFDNQLHSRINNQDLDLSKWYTNIAQGTNKLETENITAIDFHVNNNTNDNNKFILRFFVLYDN